jgi:hypothetical protein
MTSASSFFGTEPGRVRIYDTMRQSVKRDASLPNECYPTDFSRFGWILIRCHTGLGPDTYKIMQRGTGQLRDVHDPYPHYSSFYGVGRHWISGRFSAPPRPRPAYLNWRTGEYRAGELGNRNLDSPTLKPLDPRTYDRVYWGGPDRDWLYLRKRDGSRVRLSRCLKVCTFSSVARGYVAWIEEHTVVRGYEMATGRRYAWRMEVAPGVQRYGAVIPFATAYSVIISVDQSAATYVHQLYEARWRP